MLYQWKNKKSIDERYSKVFALFKRTKKYLLRTEHFRQRKRNNSMWSWFWGWSVSRGGHDSKRYLEKRNWKRWTMKIVFHAATSVRATATIVFSRCIVWGKGWRWLQTRLILLRWVREKVSICEDEQLEILKRYRCFERYQRVVRTGHLIQR